MPGDTLYKHWSYHKTTFLPEEWYLDLIAFPPNHVQCSKNPTGTKDAINEMFFDEQAKKVNVEMLGSTVRYDENGQEIESLSWNRMDVPQPDYDLENVIAMITQ